ncbi:MAG: hypothetical protein PHU25_20595 [Deltaproteobacteria bacterium]|nr:hypothetical protein [Deltaproteobacteria bacterium]
MNATHLLLVAAVGLLLLGCNDGNSSDADAAPDSGVSGWDAVSVDAANAPDRTMVRIELSADPGAALAKDPKAYELSSPNGALAVTDVSYDAKGAVVVLTTEKQKLGVTYTATIPGNGDGRSADFPAADTASFYASDFTTMGQYTLAATRAAIGEHCVVYVEDGQVVNTASDIVAYFDEKVEPTESAFFTAPPDKDGNNRIVLLALDGKGQYGGYFDPTNTFSDAEAMAMWGTHSNEMEMIYVDALSAVDYYSLVIPHEYQHLLYNFRHGTNAEYWAYHDEGLAECAAMAVNGENDYAVTFYSADYQGLIAKGLSLVNWTWGLYENYAVAYLFWTYVAGRMGGVDAYGDIFDLDIGRPDEVGAFLNARLGEGFAQVQLDEMIAIAVQAPQGDLGFNGLVEPGLLAHPHAPSGTDSLDLEPYAGAFFGLFADTVDYPGTQGPDIVYAGVAASGETDLAAPFSLGPGGLLVALNGNQEWSSFPTEHSGPDLPALKSASTRAPHGGLFVSPAWRDPPPLRRDAPGPVLAWRESMLAR